MQPPSLSKPENCLVGRIARQGLAQQGDIMAEFSSRGRLVARERFMQQHFDVSLVPQPFGFSLPLRQCNLVIIQADRDLTRSGRQNLLHFPVNRGTVPVDFRGESLFRLNCVAAVFPHSVFSDMPCEWCGWP
jgi:hypothetical protein